MSNPELYVYVVPAAGKQVRDPRPGKPKFLPETGDRVPNDMYWRRRIAEGSCSIPKPERKAKNSNPEVK